MFVVVRRRWVVIVLFALASTLSCTRRPFLSGALTGFIATEVPMLAFCSSDREDCNATTSFVLLPLAGALLAGAVFWAALPEPRSRSREKEDPLPPDATAYDRCVRKCERVHDRCTDKCYNRSDPDGCYENCEQSSSLCEDGCKTLERNRENREALAEAEAKRDAQLVERGIQPVRKGQGSIMSSKCTTGTSDIRSSVEPFNRPQMRVTLTNGGSDNLAIYYCAVTQFAHHPAHCGLETQVAPGESSSLIYNEEQGIWLAVVGRGDDIWKPEIRAKGGWEPNECGKELFGLLKTAALGHGMILDW